MEEWQSRVEDEWLDLIEKIGKLEEFLDEPPVELTPQQSGDLIQQLYYMKKYRDVLAHRIQNFT